MKKQPAHKAEPAHFKQHLIFTGGTIDSRFAGNLDTVVPTRKSAIPELLTKFVMIPKDRNKMTTLYMKDSRNLDEPQLRALLAAVVESSCRQVIITIGTYAMPDVARYLEVALTETDKVIVLTGSIVPITGFTPTDAPFNLGFAMAKAEHLKKGVYVAMNGQVLLPNEVFKHFRTASFRSIRSRP